VSRRGWRPSAPGRNLRVALRADRDAALRALRIRPRRGVAADRRRRESGCAST